MPYTPMIQQYLAIKKDYQDAFLFFRLGDFYEMFFDDAKKAAEELEITLTSRDGGGDERIPMCGVPYHSANHYIERLIEKGYKVAICEQIEDPKLAKGVVKREVIRVITPGTVMDEGALNPKENNYIGAVAFDGRSYGLIFLDLTTGEGRSTVVGEPGEVAREIASFHCREIVVDESSEAELRPALAGERITFSREDGEAIPNELAAVTRRLENEAARRAAGKLLQYLLKNRQSSLGHLQAIEPYDVFDYMVLNAGARRNLEIMKTLREGKKHGSLLWILDRTMTAMGGRKLKQWLEKPLIDREAIEKRLSAVEALKEHFIEREALRESLRRVYDLERLVGRVSYGNVNARELNQLKRSLAEIPEIIDILKNIDHKAIHEFVDAIDPCGEVHAIIDEAIVDDPPASVTDGGMIKDGYHPELDEYRYIQKNGKSWLAELEQKEREATGIKSLKIGYNKVFGYYIEVTKPNLKYLPEGRYERKQTLTNAERFITPELKEKEQLITEAEEKISSLEYQLFQTIREQIKSYAERLQKLARVIAEIDVLQSFATISDEYGYTRPTFTERKSLRLINSRHPVVERVLTDQSFVANDIVMDEACDILLITGPNMGGKSTYMRQAALIAIMAQIGCFVPADEAVLPIFDQIFTRIGAADDLVSGQSTFMVEMSEAEDALSHATPQSMILLDEIGRGTSTYDGIAIARAMIEYIHDHVGAKTLFSTHYHELTDLEATLPRLKNVHVGAIEEDGRLIFLHKVMPGYADKSYGIHVAELARLPKPLIERATAILEELEQHAPSVSIRQAGGSPPPKEAEGRAAAPDLQEPGGNGSARQASGTGTEPMAGGTQETLSTGADADGDRNERSPNDLKAGGSGEQLSLFAEAAPAAPPLAKKERDVIKRLKQLNLLDMTPMEAMNRLYELQQKLKD